MWLVGFLWPPIEIGGYKMVDVNVFTWADLHRVKRCRLVEEGRAEDKVVYKRAFINPFVTDSIPKSQFNP